MFYELRYVILQCYMDLEILYGIERFNDIIKKKQVSASEIDVARHICELVKSNLAMSIWKSYFDNNKDANTISHLRNEIAMFLKEQDSKINLPKRQKNKIIDQLRKPLCKMRNELLAHQDSERVIDKILIKDLSEMTNVLVAELNDISNHELLINELKPIKTSEIELAKLNASMGIELLISANRFSC